ncbi:TolC family outer membrane protein [Microvirga sp. W0021]|uniref:TolC family outer membrane protein n=1 Tax=Hohaiivirga grylli TaxID=3133970 RepID=A0ABV0BMF3_9HYPH
MRKQADKKWRLLLVGAVSAAAFLAGYGISGAETINGALVKAYQSNPDLNAQRAGLRATDENVARAKAGYRPSINATASVGRSFTNYKRPGLDSSTDTYLSGRSIGLEIDQTIFDGFKTYNSVKQAESQVLSTRESLRNEEQTTLFNAAQAYMNVLRDTAILNLNRNNVEVLQEQLRQTTDRFNVGEVTRTDVAQAEASLAGARSQVSAAEANLSSSLATYRQVIGEEPRKLAPGRPLDKLLPKRSDAALNIALQEHPAIVAAMHAVDASELQVKVAEADFLPTLGVSGTVRDYRSNTYVGDKGLNASIVAQLKVPIYQGGATSASTRQAKETVGQIRLQADSIRDQVRAAVISAWGQLEAAKAQITAYQAQVNANEVALNGVREEARVGQRTTLDVLNAQQTLLNSRVLLITAQRDRIVASYAVVQAMGRLTARYLALDVAHYDPSVHYDQIKDSWGGIMTPDGK